jgi:amidohydrolase
MNVNELYIEAKAIAPWMVEIRRALHRIPENGFQEFKTQAYLTKQLEAMAIPYTTQRTWIVADIKGGHPGPTVALRADMDALPIAEPADCPFRSGHEGWMHACGHDFHMTIQLAAAKLLSAKKEALRGNVRLLFQPAEETVGGAAPMVAAGVMEGVDAVYGLHVQPYMNVGQADTRSGCLNGSTDGLNIVVKGVSGHASRPHLCVDAIVCAAQLITTLQTVVSRNASPLLPAVLSLGTIHGGDAQNIICDRVELHGTLRTADPTLRAQLKQRIRAICDGVAAACGATIELEIVTGYAALMNTPSEAERVIRVARSLLGNENAAYREAPSMGGEDFSYFLEQAPGAFWHLGCAPSQPAPPLHSRDFVPDERCLPIGAAIQSALVLDRMGILD